MTRVDKACVGGAAILFGVCLWRFTGWLRHREDVRATPHRAGHLVMGPPC